VNCIYQHWDGPMPRGEIAGRDEMRGYAERIGAEYIFDRDRIFFPEAKASYGRFRILHDPEFQCYDDVLYADTDVWPVEGLAESPFPLQADIGICTEPLQPTIRKASIGPICTANDERWAQIVRRTWGIEMPRQDGSLKVYNAGMQVWSRDGRRKAQQFVRFSDYIKVVRGLPAFYASDQHYLHAMMFLVGLKVKELDNDWNRYVHYLTRGREIVGVSDQRTPTTKFVHVQLRGAGEYDRETLWRIVNSPQGEWRL